MKASLQAQNTATIIAKYHSCNVKAITETSQILNTYNISLKENKEEENIPQQNHGIFLSMQLKVNSTLPNTHEQ